MSKDTKQSKPDDPPPAPPKGNRNEAWRPRMDTQRVLHGFPNYNQEGDPLTQSPNITDPNDDTAPLQGSGDRSDEDSVVTGARPAGADNPSGPERTPKKGG